MILKGENTTVKARGDWAIPIMLTVLGLLVAGLLLRSPTASRPQKDHAILVAYCSAEHVEGDRFVDNGISFEHGNTQSPKRAMKGKYSSGLTDRLYGFSYIIQKPVPGATYRATVWRRGNNTEQSYLEVKEVGGQGFDVRTHRISEKGYDYWTKLQIIFTIPVHRKVNGYEIFVTKDPGSGDVFFDELRIERLPMDTRPQGTAFREETFEVQVAPEDAQKLKDIKKRSIKDGLYIRRESDEVKAKVGSTSPLMPAKIRFKGDWLDHLDWKGESYRIKLKGESAWRGMRVFSVQRAIVRGNLREWVYHQWLRREDVLSPRYDFIRFRFNGADPKPYAYEEHFTKHLVEHQKRREGPIVKFNENRFWEGIKRSFDVRDQLPDGRNKDAAWWSSEILPFEAKRVKKSPVLAQEFEQAKTLMHQYKYHLAAPDAIFDMKRLAKWVAISELMRAHHALTWHNQRFYYNPITNILEPIGYDGFGQESPPAHLYTVEAFQKGHFSYEPLRQLFHTKPFLRAYFKELDRMSQPGYINTLLAQMDEGIREREGFLRAFTKSYHYDREAIRQQAKMIQMTILPFDNSLQVYTQGKDRDSLHLQLVNYHKLPLEVLTSFGKQESLLIMPQEEGQEPQYIALTVPKNIKHLRFALPGTDRIKTAAIQPFALPLSHTARQGLERLRVLPEGVSGHGDEVVIKGVVQIDTPLHLDPAKRVRILAGTHIVFSGPGSMVSRAPVFFEGTEAAPIEVSSTDGKGGAIVVLQSPELSKIAYTTFRNLNTFRLEGWQLSGAVTFFESDVTVSHTRFLSNHCEDGLNIVKSHFEVDDCYFEGTMSDAFDADFCTGTLKNTHFSHTGNDAIDFSTSRIKIENCTMSDIGDKGISVGEHSHVTAKDIVIDGAVMGVASKDLSILTVDHITLKHCETGFAAYQKKPEFGPAHIRCGKYTAEDVKRLKMIETGSTFVQPTQND